MDNSLVVNFQIYIPLTLFFALHFLIIFGFFRRSSSYFLITTGLICLKFSVLVKTIPFCLWLTLRYENDLFLVPFVGSLIVRKCQNLINFVKSQFSNSYVFITTGLISSTKVEIVKFVLIQCWVENYRFRS